MLCALTVRTLKPGTFEEFKEAFVPTDLVQPAPTGWVRFNMIRNVENPDEVISFGFSTAPSTTAPDSQEQGYAEQMAKIAPYVQSVGADGLYEIVEEMLAN